MDRCLRLAALALLLGACATPVTSVPGATLPSSAPPATSSPTAEPTPAEERQLTVKVGGDERHVRVFLPPLDAGERAPLLVLLHGNNESTSVMLDASGADALAAREGVIVALPPGHDRRWEALIWPGDEMSDSPDVAFLSGMLDQLRVELPVDPSRVYLAGFSMGAVLADRMACQAADRVTAVAVAAGTPWSEVCEPVRPVSVLVMHGTADNVFAVDDAEALADRWRRVNACPGAPASEPIGADAVAVRSEGCAGGTSVEFVRIEGQPHRWFDEPDATELAWRFFAEALAP